MAVGRRSRVLVLVAAAVALMVACTSPDPGDDGARSTGTPSTGAPVTSVATTTDATSATTTDTTAATKAAPTTGAPGPRTRRPGWVAAENARPGTDAWQITAREELGWIEGYTRATSVRPGEALALFVDTGSPSYTVEAYRLGWYGGARGRLVWTSPPQEGRRQPPPFVDRTTGLAEARWSPSLDVPVGEDWPPGTYLLKLVSSAGGSSHVPVTVRDDDAHADLVIVNSVTTWQAYNPWGGCSLYACPTLDGPERAVKVSYDRPYARTYHDGAANVGDHELPLISLAEELGLDVAYVTNLDVHRDPTVLRRYRGVISLGHDEYYSTVMREALVAARDAGVHLAFLGANAVYRHIRFEPASDGLVDRVLVNYRDRPDPIAATDPTEATREWRAKGRPEAELVGIQYVCAGVRADLVVANAGHWVWAGAGVTDGQALPDLVGNEADGAAEGISPDGLELLAVSPVRCGGARTGHTSFYRAPSGAGVFASGTIWWICALEAGLCTDPANVAPVRAATANVLRAFTRPPTPVGTG